MSETSENQPLHVRRTLYFSGRVQGVGFRYTTEDVASRFAVTGYVRNLRDGRVELVAEGSATELDHLQDAVVGAMRDNIRETQTIDSPATGEFTSFRIAF